MASVPEKSGVVVVGVDGPGSVGVLRWAAGEVAGTRATLEVVTAWQWPGYWGRDPLPEGWDPAEHAEKMQTQVLDEVFGPHPDLQVRKVVVEGRPSHVLVEASEHADLLVVGRHGEGALPRAMLGSVSLHCVAHAKCAVLVVPAGQSSD